MSLPLRRRARRLAAITLAGTLVLAGCGAERAEENPRASGNQEAQAFPVTLTPAEGEPVTLDARPERIVSLSASNTETLFAVGAGEQVVAVDEQSDFPADAPRTDLSGLTPNVEAIAGYDPDLVVLSDDVDDVAAALTRLDHPVLIVPAARTIDDVYAGMELLGKATGHADEAADLADRMRTDLDKVVADAPKPSEPLTYYHELDTTYYSATSKTFIGQVYGLFGLENIADPADKDAGGYPQLSVEHILAADPDLIFLADVECCGQSAETVAARPGWSALSAVKNGNVVELDDDLASRWGPRVVDLARSVADAVAKAGQGG
ncbi:ABC transporter substrate-binding protein [Actinophytocola gossypii]|uniref:ABC transporter substrate-binding protein n=1 Tax=Actinophytocola gossypii TaxID=2812003 RepID=A0ABT2JC75_9PSEU|nr:ABC transporter substrate-binding protein [Actinophytocola gossypii]MCT2585311.1 ABC transporter substrate-binding protein [Actinophytocola gossypii]